MIPCATDRLYYDRLQPLIFFKKEQKGNTKDSLNVRRINACPVEFNLETNGIWCIKISNVETLKTQNITFYQRNLFSMYDPGSFLSLTSLAWKSANVSVNEPFCIILSNDDR